MIQGITSLLSNEWLFLFMSFTPVYMSSVGPRHLTA